MHDTTCHLSISLDGFVAGPEQSRDNPLGGASTVRQALNAGVIDELILDVAPALLGGGAGLLDGVESFDCEPVEVLHSPLATHIRYRRVAAR